MAPLQATSRLRLSALFGGALLLLAGLSGCFEKEVDTCEYWVPKLTSPQRGDKALRKVEAMKCKDALPTLAQMFDDGLFQDRILRVVKHIGDKEGGASVLRTALMNRDTGKLACSIVQDWELAAARPELEKILTGTALPKHRPEALLAMLSFEKAENIEDLLISLAAADPNLQGIQVNRMAVDKLGELKSQRAIPTVIQTAFMRDNRGQKIYQAARTALARIGPTAVDLLIQTVDGKNEELKKYARAEGIQDWEWRYGPEIVQLLTDQLQGKVGVALARNMTHELNKPPGVSPAMEERWRVGQLNRLKISMLGMGHAGPASAVAPLKAIVLDPLADAVNQRLHSATSLALIGTKEAQAALLEIFDTTKDDRFRGPLLQPMGMGLDMEHQTKFFALKLDTSPYLQEQLKEKKFATYTGVVAACKADMGCYAQKLQSEDKDEVVKAAVMLARATGDAVPAARKALTTKFVNTPANNIDVRRFTLMALTRIGDVSTGEELLKIAQNLDPSDKYWPAELEVYGAALLHRGSE